MGQMGKKKKPQTDSKERDLMNNQQNIKDRSEEDEDQLKFKRSAKKEKKEPADIKEKEKKEVDQSAQMEKALEEEKLKAKESYDRLLRISAEFDNYKKRKMREIEEYRKYANEALIRELLSVVDNLERAVDSATTGKQKKDKSLIEGVGMTLKEILTIFEKFHVQPIDSVGKPFDPSFHQAMAQEETDKHPSNTVLKEFQKGYLIHDRLLRPAMVIVSKRKANENEK